MPTPLERVTLVLKLADAGDWTRARHETLALQKDLTMWRRAVDHMLAFSVTEGVYKNTAAGALDLLSHAADHLREYSEYPPGESARNVAMACALEGVAMLKAVREQANSDPVPLEAHPSGSTRLCAGQPECCHALSPGSFKKGVRAATARTLSRRTRENGPPEQDGFCRPGLIVMLYSQGGLAAGTNGPAVHPASAWQDHA